MAWRCSRPRASSAFSLNPDRPIRRTFYSCGKTFALEPLRELLQPAGEQRQLGVVLAHGRETALFRVSGNIVQKLATVQVTTQKTHRKGGMSQARIGRMRDSKKQHNADYVLEHVERQFLDHGRGGQPSVSALLVGGSAEMPTMLLGDLPPELRSIVVGDTAHAWPDVNADAFVAAMRDEIERFELAREREQLAVLHSTLATAPELLDFGAERIQERLGLYRNVFVDARAHPDVIALANDENLPANLTVHVIRVANDLDDFDGIIAIKHMP